MALVKVGDINMYYEIHGQGEPLVMICGASSTTDAYSMLIPTYSAEYKLILFDNRGAGKTDKPDIPYTIRMIAGDMAGLLSAIGIESVYVYGPSMGGVIAQEFALRYPQRVKKLVLINTTCGNRHGIPLTPSKRFNRELRSMMTPEEVGEETLRLCVTDDYIERHPDIAKMLKEDMTRNSGLSYAMFRQAEAIQEYDSYDRLNQISAPTLILAGDADRAVPFGNSKILAAKIKGAELVIFKNAGHVLIEASDEPTRLILDFLRRPVLKT